MLQELQVASKYSNEVDDGLSFTYYAEILSHIASLKTLETTSNSYRFLPCTI